jgi:glutathione S-transferase
MIKLYGTAMSRAGRCLWALEEVGAKYEHVPTAIADTHSPAHLKLNPNGHIPVLDDNGFIVWESMAINLYVAEKYGKSPLWPATVEGRTGVYQWSFWAMTEAEPPTARSVMPAKPLMSRPLSSVTVRPVNEMLPVLVTVMR